jgi:prepilin-type N-terminal cleavage/methylation domain-containing protein
MKINRQGFTLLELLVVITIAGIFIALAVAFVGGSTSDGARVGTVVKFSHKGSVFKSWEGELSLGGNTSTKFWEFSVTDDAVVKEVQSAMDSQKTVKMKYHQKRFRNPTSSDTNYIVDEVVLVGQ